MAECCLCDGSQKGTARCILNLQTLNYNFQVYFRIRREFLEYRSVFNTIMATKMDFSVEELAEIERKWDSLRLQLEAAASRAEKSLPEPYASLSVWTADGQLLITKPLSLDTDKPKKSAQQLQKMISEHIVSFFIY